MNLNIQQISLVVKDYDETIEFYTKKLPFELVEDTQRSPTKRWVRIKPIGKGEVTLLLALAKDEEQLSRVGNQTGNRVALFLYTDDIERDLKNMTQNGVKIRRPLSEESFGKVLLFEDLYGNIWDLIQPKSTNL